ncbi:hypothetical protein [Halopseudomonas bauzanensis]|uniref:hypothetical protein n=1 Tax=Halopseudomonas bauzanensis TaxID=653930 RepID=UPI002553BDDD|nr:hypothetical protein [Halopseudomonas bauzanensis]
MKGHGFIRTIGEAALLVRRPLLAIGLVAQTGNGTVNEGAGVGGRTLAASATAIETAGQHNGEGA